MIDPNDYIYEMGESASFATLILSGKLGVVAGDTLFVHGAVDARSMGLVPVDETRFEMPPPGAEAEVRYPHPQP